MVDISDVHCKQIEEQNWMNSSKAGSTAKKYTRQVLLSADRLTSSRLPSSIGGMLLRPTAALLIALFCVPAQAWNSLGHKAVAEIAWQQLEPSERQAIVDILRRHPTFATDFQAK